MQTTQVDQEAVALARCYALLLQKAQERRARLAAETAVSPQSKDEAVKTAVSSNSSSDTQSNKEN